MATKKDLTAAITDGANEINRGIDRFFSANDKLNMSQTPEAPEAQEAYEAYEAYEVEPDKKKVAAEERRTQGRKGCKLPRMMVSFTPSEYDFIRTMAAITGKTITRYINDLVDRDMETKRDTYSKAKEIIKDAD